MKQSASPLQTSLGNCEISRALVKIFADKIGVPVELWAGRCYEIASLLVKNGVLEGKPRYGMYRGPISPSSLFRRRVFSQHGWIEQEESIVDPTRWVFEATNPYLYVCSKDNDEYDVGANNTKLELLGESEVPEFDGSTRVIPFPLDLRLVSVLQSLLPQRQKDISLNQAFVLLNMHPKKFSGVGKALVAWAATHQLLALIPLDNVELLQES